MSGTPNDPQVVQAVLGAPAFLSGLTDVDIGIIKIQVAKRVAPEVASAKAETAKALSDAEQGWRSAIAQIRDRAGLRKSPRDGAEKNLRAAAAIDAA